MPGRPVPVGIKAWDEINKRVKIKVKKPLALLFIGTNKEFRIVAREFAANPGNQGLILVVALPKFGFEHKYVLLLFKKWMMEKTS